MSRPFAFLKRRYPGILVFILSLVVYSLTMSPTVSFWDCGEFISSAAGLLVPHPPGAPLYLLLGRLFAFLAPAPSLVALFVNFLSVLASAFTIFFIYNILTLILGIIGDGTKKANRFSVEVSSVTGALLFAFTDTFWYSAVEAEVYALSLFFSAATLWAFLKWYVQKGSDSRLFFLGVYLLGLSIGVHLLNLLLVPVFALLTGWKQEGCCLKSTVKSLIAGVVVLAALYWGLIVNGLWPAMKLELLMVNSFGFPQHSGLIIWLIFLFFFHIVVMAFSYRKNAGIHVVFLVSALVLVGWFSYMLVPIRAAANPRINMNAPDNVFALNDYLNRTQYGSRPLLYGVYAGAVAEDWATGYQYHFNEKLGQYEKIPASAILNFNRDDYVWFPRIYSRQQQHLRGYEWWTGLDATSEKPRFINQIDFFMKYQMGNSFLRYLMWNFVGRQNDNQGHGDILSGNWASGINIIDRQFLGNRGHLTAEDQFTPAANYYFGVPFIFALLGFFFLIRRGRGRRGILVLLGVLFFMTGPAIVFFLNQPPYEPRERDYVYVASFMSMAMFAAIGVYSLLVKINSSSGSVLTGILSAVLIFVAGPGLLFSVNFSDHDRSGRYLARDLAVSQLRSCPSNAILFTYGDNDTYPLWYAQQVEKVRPDIRVVNLGLLGTPWYVEQVKQPVSGIDGLKMILPYDFYLDNSIEFFSVSPIHSTPVAGINALKRILDDEGPGEMLKGVFRNEIHPIWEIVLPSHHRFVWEIQGRYLSAGTIALADVIVSNGQKRPVCFTRNVESSELLGLENHFESHGLVWLLADGKGEEHLSGQLAKESAIFCDSISIPRGDSWYDNTCRQMLSLSGYRELSLELARKLLEDGQKEEAQIVLNKSLREWPYTPYQKQSTMLEMAQLLLNCGESGKAENLVRNITYVNIQDVYYFVNSGFSNKDIRRKYFRLFHDLRLLAKRLKMKNLLIEMEMDLQGLFDF
jgi:hypothetical protein